MYIICAYIYIYTHMCIYIYMYTCIYIHTTYIDGDGLAILRQEGKEGHRGL